MNNRIGIVLAGVRCRWSCLPACRCSPWISASARSCSSWARSRRSSPTPGLHFKWPFIQNVRYFDTRILTLDTPDAERYHHLGEEEPAGGFVRQMAHQRRRASTTSASAATRRRRRRACRRPSMPALREEFGKRTVHEVVSRRARQDHGIDARARPTQDAKKIGVEIIDVRLKRVDLPQEVSESVYSRMEAERKRVANELRSTGAREAEKIRAEADKAARGDHRRRPTAMRSASRARATPRRRRSTRRRSARIPSSTPFTAAWKPTARASRTSSDVLVLEPNSEFFKYLKSPGKRQRSSADAERADGDHFPHGVRADAGDRGRPAVPGPGTAGARPFAASSSSATGRSASSG